MDPRTRRVRMQGGVRTQSNPDPSISSFGLHGPLIEDINQLNAWTVYIVHVCPIGIGGCRSVAKPIPRESTDTRSRPTTLISALFRSL